MAAVTEYQDQPGNSKCTSLPLLEIRVCVSQVQRHMFPEVHFMIQVRILLCFKMGYSIPTIHGLPSFSQLKQLFSGKI